MAVMVDAAPLRLRWLPGLWRLAAGPALVTWQPWLVALAAGLLTFALHGYRLRLAPDLFSDEGLYLLVAQNVARGAGLVDYFGLFLWHPPVFMLVEAIYLRLSGLLYQDVVSMLLGVRWINVFFSAASAGVLVLLGQKLHGYRAGLLMAALFMVDPFVQRTNRRAMLETFALFCVLLGLYLFFTHAPRLSRGQRLGAGLAFGLAMLTKELLALELLTVLVFTAWARRSQLRDALRVALVAGLVYLVYPAWTFAIGQGGAFLEWKVFNLARFLDLFRFFTISEPGQVASLSAFPGAPGPSFLESLAQVLGIYGSSYVLLGLGSVLLMILALSFWRAAEARFVASWIFVSYGFVGVGMVLGKIGDQFFYFLIVPVIVASGYFLAQLLDTDGLPARKVRTRRAWLRVARPLFIGLFVFNGWQWADKYVVGEDHSYSDIYYFVRQNVPRGTTLVVGSDVNNYLFLPDYDVQFVRNTDEVLEKDYRYFILSSKDRWGRYHGVTPEFYDWVVGESRPLIEGYGTSFWKLGLYYRDPRDAAPGTARALDALMQGQTEGPIEGPPAPAVPEPVPVPDQPGAPS